MKLYLCLAIFFIAAHSAYGKIFTRCELANELKRQGFPAKDLRNWVCLVEAESNRNSLAKGGPNFDGSYDFGIFQINSRFWCGLNSVGGDCNTRCDSFLNNDIKTSCDCAKKIWNRHGWSAWKGWTAKCQGALPDLTPCGL